MADFNRKKLQVFVSSTFTDLIKERQAAVEAILTAGHIPAGMELFTAGDESQMEVIKQWIDESDVYLLILGGRYGSIEPNSGKSYTQLEYEYAISKNKSLFACVINDDAIEARVKTDGRIVLETENPQKLKEFRTIVLSKMSKFWDDTKDIKIAVTETLSHFSRREELVGWVRSSSQSDLPAIADEIARLSKENAQLRNQVATSQEDKINGLTFLELKTILDQERTAEYFFRHIYQLPDDRYVFNENIDLSKRLALRGLLIYKTNHYTITEAGRAFLNKYESWQLASNEAAQLKVENPTP